MGLFRRKDEHAIPKPGTPEFEAAVAGTAIPDSQSVSMGDEGWTSTPSGSDPQVGSTETVDLSGTEKREDVEEVLREHGIDPNKKGQTIDADSVPGLKGDLLRVLFGGQMRRTGVDGIAGGISTPKQTPSAMVEQLAKQRDDGQITDAEFEAQKRRILRED